MKIKNVRLGHACNSSSSHSIVLTNRAHDDMAGDMEFGWGFFTAASKESKMAYLAQTIRANLASEIGDFNAAHVAMSITGVQFRKDDMRAFEGYVDHQSVLNLPYSIAWDKRLSPEFLADLTEYMMRDDVAVLGGNDNTTEDHPLASEPRPSWARELGTDGTGDLRCRKDGDWWTLFNRDTGARVSLSFEDNPRELRPSTPFLLDVKVTDYCPFGCAYCYQGSTKDGKHGDASAYDLVNAEVFEVAIGGGEPTLWKDFESFTETLNRYGINANATTRNYKWLESADADKTMKHLSALAVSVETAEQVRQIITAVTGKPWAGKIVFQVIDGVVAPGDAKEIVKLCAGRFDLCVLGYKTTGFGEQYEPRYLGAVLEQAWPYLDWEWRCSQTPNAPGLSLRVDTVMAQRYESEFQKRKIAPVLYHTHEGIWSAYFDAVAGTLAPSSYCDKSKAVPTGRRDGWQKRDWLRDAFSRMQRANA